jgi:XRE family aerobic/anaerobic benzoate catabolism transcriptional regulator
MAKDICAATGERIRKLRRAKGWRQIDLAEHSGVHEVHISDLERGTREPGLRTLSKIVTALGTTLSEMLGTVTETRAVERIAEG